MSVFDDAQMNFLTTDWDALSLDDAIEAAVTQMDDWEFAKNVPDLQQGARDKITVDEVVTLMWRALNSGMNKRLRFK